MAIKLAQLDLEQPLPESLDASGYSGMWVLIRDHGLPVGYVRLRDCTGAVSRERLATEITSQLGGALVRRELRRILESASPHREAYTPSMSVLVCTRDRPESLRRTLDCLLDLDYPDYEVLVVDNCPSDCRTALVASDYPFRYTVEPVPGHSSARNTAIRESSGEVVVFLDDDMVVERDWLRHTARSLANPEVVCVTGLVLPAELETDAQVLFEGIYGGFCCGYEEKTFPADYGWKQGLQGLCHDAGPFMAFRRSVFDAVGTFDPALGGSIGGGEDTDLLHRITRAGFTISYSVRAVRFHRHRVDDRGLASQLRGYGRSYTALLTKCLIEEKEIRGRVIRRLAGYYWHWGVRRIFRRLLRRERMPMRFVLAEFGGALGGPRAYLRKRKAIHGHGGSVSERPALSRGRGLSSTDATSR